MDIQAKVKDIIQLVQKDKDFKEKFQQDPFAAVKTVVGVDTPNDQLNQLVEGVKAKVSLEETGDMFGKVKGMFEK